VKELVCESSPVKSSFGSQILVNVFPICFTLSFLFMTTIEWRFDFRVQLNAPNPFSNFQLPTMSDQPRLSDQFKNEVESPHHLQHVKTVEKQVLPTQEGKFFWFF
jgi:hypothetical protein